MVAKKSIDLSLVVPCYNEGSNIGVVLEEITTHLQCNDVARYEIIVVNDGSTDNTTAVLKKAKARYPALRVATHDRNLGLGMALRTGFALTRGKYVSFLPADGEVGADQLLKIYALREKADAVVTARIRNNIYPFYREILSFGWRKIMRVLLGFDAKKMDGIYLIRGEMLRSFKLRSTSGFVQYEIMMNCVKRKAVFVKSTMECRPRLSGFSKVLNLRTIAKSLVEPLKLRLAMRFGTSDASA